MIEQFLHALQAYQLPVGKDIILACSGGSDSVAMVVLFASTQDQHQCRLRIAHVDHGLRGIHEAEKDASIVQSLAKKYQLPLDVLSCNVQDWQEQGTGLEAAARRQRYARLQELAQQYSCASIALAHNQDDQIETVYMRLMQSYGVTGLAGIPHRRANLIRPLLVFSKEELRQYLHQQTVSWNEDCTNQTPIFLRNRARKELPLLEKTKPGFMKALLHLSQECDEVHMALESLMQPLYACEDWGPRGVTFPLDLFLKQTILCRDRLLYRWFNLIMRGQCMADFRLPKRFVRSIKIGKGPILLRGYGILLTKKKNLLYFTGDGEKCLSDLNI